MGCDRTGRGSKGHKSRVSSTLSTRHAPQMGTDFIAISIPSHEKPQIAQTDSAVATTKTPRHEAGSARVAAMKLVFCLIAFGAFIPSVPRHNWGEVSRVPRRAPAGVTRMRRTASYVDFAKHLQEGCIGARIPPPTVARCTSLEMGR